MRRAAAAAFLVLLSAGAAPAADPVTTPPQPPLNESVRKVRNLLAAAPSPDGRQVAAVITDPTEASGRPHLWLLPTDGGPARQITFSGADAEPGEQRPAWAGDGSALYFLAKRGEPSRVYRLSLLGGEAEPLKIARSASGTLASGWSLALEGQEAVEVSAVSDEISPDDRTLAVVALDGDTAVRAAQLKKKDDAVEVGRGEHKARLYLVDMRSGAAREVPLADDVRQVRWSRGSKDLAVVTEPSDSERGPAARAWRVDAASGLPVALKAIPATVHDAQFAPGAVVYEAQSAEDAPPGCSDLYVQDLATGATRDLTRGLKGSLGPTVILSPDGASVIADVMVGLRSKLARIELVSGRIDWIDLPGTTIASASSNLAQTGWALVASGPTTPPAVWFTPRLGTPPVKLAGPAIVPPDWPKTPSRPVSWTNNGLRLDGLYYQPKLGPGAKAPLVVVVHGGPTYAFQDGYANLVQILVAQGWAVFLPNPRGSLGRGAAFAAANKNDLGGGDYSDIMTGVDAVAAAYPVDQTRMALIGYSYGGEMAGFVEGRTNRFRALVSGAPVIDQFSEYGTETDAWYDRWFYGLPWDHFADAWRQSPLARVREAKTPLLLLQGEDDPTDPLGQSQEMRRAMKEIGAGVVLITYPRETHASLGAAFAAAATREPWHGDDLRRRMIAFISDAFAGKAVN